MQNEGTTHERKLLNAGVDWLTCSKAGSVRGSLWESTASLLLLDSMREGEKPTLATWQGYAGLKTSATFVGMSGDSGLCRLSGPHSPTLVQKLITAADNVSRIDLQMTVELLPPDPMFGDIEFEQLALGGGRPGFRPIITKIHNTHGGHTNAVGSRLSDAYGRSYDKGIESGNVERGKYVRYEVEYKRGLAKKIASQIALNRKALDLTARTVYRYFVRNGVQPLRTEPKGGLIDQAHPDRSKPDYLAYLTRNVRKPVRRAIECHGLHAVLEALGLLDRINSEGGV